VRFREQTAPPTLIDNIETLLSGLGLYVFRGSVRFREQTAPPTLIYNICDPLVPTRPQRSTCNDILQRLCISSERTTSLARHSVSCMRDNLHWTSSIAALAHISFAFSSKTLPPLKFAALFSRLSYLQI
jgi:hypothetical protein